jgi:hypothetical protein
LFSLSNCFQSHRRKTEHKKSLRILSQASVVKSQKDRWILPKSREDWDTPHAHDAVSIFLMFQHVSPNRFIRFENI